MLLRLMIVLGLLFGRSFCLGGRVVFIVQAIRAFMPISEDFRKTELATGLERLFEFIDSAFGTTRPIFFLQCPASSAGCLQVMLTEWALDEIFAYRVATFRAELIFAGCVGQCDSDDFVRCRQTLPNQSNAIVLEWYHS